MRRRDVRDWRVIARLDVDAYNGRPGSVAKTGDVRRTFDALRFMHNLASNMDACSGVAFRVTHRRTARGWHVTVWSDLLVLEPAEVVALQAVCGSDWRREAFMLVRAVGLPDAPPPWRPLFRWDSFYRSHDRGVNYDAESGAVRR